MDRVSPNFAHALILTRSRLGLLLVIFRKFVTELWPLIDVRILFPVNILRGAQWLVVECLTRDLWVAGSCLIGGTALCP